MVLFLSGHVLLFKIHNVLQPTWTSIFPLSTQKNSLVCLKVSDTREVEIDQAIPNNRTSSFCEKGMKVEILSMAPAETNCSGLFCDHQRAVDTTREKEKVVVVIRWTR